jgi:hypothetical protein
MKYLISWRVHDDKRHEALQAFSAMTPEDDQADTGDNLELIGRWHDLVGFTGVAICETTDPAAIANWILNWNQVIDCEATPVLDDAEARAVAREKLSDS